MENETARAQMAPPPQDVIMHMAMGALVSQALGVAAKLGIADLLIDGALPVDEIAQRTGTHAPSIYRILRTLASAGIFLEVDQRAFENTDRSDVLRSDVPGSMRNVVMFMTESWHHNAWGNLLHSARTGETAWKHTHGAEVFDWFADHPEESELFNRAMTEISAGAGPAVVEAYDFSGIGTLADIAGGHGSLLASILKANPGMKGILFDMEHVVAGAPAMLEREGVRDRVQTVSGDFFIEVPAADAYLMKHIIHDWDDERSTRILSTIHRAMPDNGRLLLVEMVVPAENEPHPSKVVDLEMLTLPGGLERTEAEYSALLQNAGFRLNRIVATRSPFSVIEGVKA